MSLRNFIANKIKWVVFGLIAVIFPLKINSAELWETDFTNQAKVIFNLNKFVKWNNASTTGINLCFLGNNSALLKNLTAFDGTKIADNLVSIKQVSDTESSLSKCQMLFIHKDKAEQLSGILHNLQNKSVLTVSDIPDFAQQGGMIGVVWLEARVKFEINLDMIKQANIYVSSRLLSLAKIVN